MSKKGKGKNRPSEEAPETTQTEGEEGANVAQETTGEQTQTETTDATATTEGASEETVPEAAATPPAPAATPKPITNASRVREQILIQKNQGVDYDKGAGVVVDWAVATLGMKKPLAKRYVKENWVRAK